MSNRPRKGTGILADLPRGCPRQDVIWYIEANSHSGRWSVDSKCSRGSIAGLVALFRGEDGVEDVECDMELQSVVKLVMSPVSHANSIPLAGRDCRGSSDAAALVYLPDRLTRYIREVYPIPYSLTLL